MTASIEMRRLMTRLVLVVLALGASGAAAPAQGVLPDTGTRVRVFFNGGRDHFVGWMLPGSADSLFLEGSGGDTLAVARKNISSLQVSRGGSRAGSTMIGMGVGLVTGGALGFAIGAPLALGGGQLGAIALGGVGFVVGGVAGYNAGGHWRDVTIAPTVGAQGAGARIALRF